MAPLETVPVSDLKAMLGQDKGQGEEKQSQHLSGPAQLALSS